MYQDMLVHILVITNNFLMSYVCDGRVFCIYLLYEIFNINYVGVRVTFGLAKNTSSLSSSFSCVQTLLSVTLMLLSGFL